MEKIFIPCSGKGRWSFGRNGGHKKHHSPATRKYFAKKKFLNDQLSISTTSTSATKATLATTTSMMTPMRRNDKFKRSKLIFMPGSSFKNSETRLKRKNVARWRASASASSVSSSSMSVFFSAAKVTRNDGAKSEKNQFLSIVFATRTLMAFGFAVLQHCSLVASVQTIPKILFKPCSLFSAAGDKISSGN